VGESLLKTEEEPWLKKGTNLFHIDFEVEKKNHKAFTYAKLVWTDFNPSEWIILHFASHTVRLEGRRLRPLYDAILSHEVALVRMQPDHHDDGGAESEPVVTKIHVSETHGKPDRFGMGTPVAGENGNG
jgi:hypothetical protein